VGVAKNIRHEGLDVEEKPEVYLPYLQPLFTVTNTNLSSLYFVIRTTGDPKSVISMVRAEILELDKEQPITNIKSLEERLSESIAQRRFNMLMLSIFAGVAMILAAVGIYGIMSYIVAQRTHEIGIRMALGARAKDILILVLSQGMALTAIGLGIGLIATLALTRIITTLLYGVSPTDPLILVAISALLAVIAFLACSISARKAIKVDPVIALREE
jgi:ABC-type antimicrobial peptide transport system permease subunit